MEEFKDMVSELYPHNSEIRTVYEAEVANAGGRLADVYDCSGFLFLRSTFPGSRNVRRRDGVRGGVALRTTATEILVHPYFFREVCSNGMIAAHALETRRLERIEGYMASPEAVEAVLAEVREVVRACSERDVLKKAVGQMRSAADREARFALTMLSMLLGAHGDQGAHMVEAILERFESGGDRSLFGLMNATTSIARDTRDAETRWRLEEAGGGVLALVGPGRTLDGDTAAPLEMHTLAH